MRRLNVEIATQQVANLALNIRRRQSNGVANIAIFDHCIREAMKQLGYSPECYQNILYKSKNLIIAWCRSDERLRRKEKVVKTSRFALLLAKRFSRLQLVQ
ncbi:MAG TPA: hypothetical protein VJC12_01070 [Candidatus Paceibacterota bacterium]